MLRQMRPFYIIIAGACALSLVADQSLTAQDSAAQESSNATVPNADISVLESGPIHEAFAEPITLDTEPDVVVPQQPPEPVPELPPETRPEGDHVIWIPGYWSWMEEDEDFVWVSGVWRSVPPGQQWIPGYWSEEANGYRWTHGFWDSQESQELLYLPAPPESLDSGPASPSPGDDYFYIPGCWRWNDNQYSWRPGFWHPAQNNWVWVPSHYHYSPRGYVFLRGYWDYPLQRRGLLYAPVRFRQPIYRQRGYAYTPTAAINLGQLTLGLFVAPRRGQYYFGNYYGQRYASAGYYPWFDYHNRRRGYDPLFAYANRGNDRLLTDLRQDYQRFAENDGRDRRDRPDLQGRPDRDRPDGDSQPDRDRPRNDDRPNLDRPQTDRPGGDQPDRGQRPDQDGDADRSRNRRPRFVQELSERNDENMVRLNEAQRREAGEREAAAVREFRQRRSEVEAEGRQAGAINRDRTNRATDAGDNARPAGQQPRGDRTQGDQPRSNQPRGDSPNPQPSNADVPRSQAPQRQRPDAQRPAGQRPTVQQPDRQAPQAGRQQRPSGPANGRFEFPQRTPRAVPPANQNPGTGTPPQIRNRAPQIPQRPNNPGGQPNVGRQGGNPQGRAPAASNRPQGRGPAAGGRRGTPGGGGGGNRGSKNK